MGKIVSVYEHFGLRTFRFTNDPQELIKFMNRGLTVLGDFLLNFVELKLSYNLTKITLRENLRTFVIVFRRITGVVYG